MDLPADPRRRMAALFDRWLVKQGTDRRDGQIGILKGRVKSLQTQRLRTEKWAQELLPLVEQARDELGGSATLIELAEWLNARNHFTATGNRHVGRNFGTTLFSVDKTIAGEAVMVCRTKMSALALSANFNASQSDMQPLEAECLQRIRSGIVLSRRLERQRPLTEDELEREAQRLAIAQADLQRADQRYVPMLARECYLTEAEFAEAVPDIERMILSGGGA